MTASAGALARRAVYASPHVVRAATVNAYGWWLARRRFAPPFPAVRRWLEQTQWWTPEELAAFQAQRLRHILAAARRDVPYYRALDGFDAIDPARCSLSDLGALPLLTRDAFRRDAGALRSETVSRRRAVREHSSGTTGERLDFLLPRLLGHTLNYALLYRFYGWAGIAVGDRRVTLGGRVLAARPPYWVHNRAENQLLLSVRHLDETTVDAYIDRMRAFRPVFVAAHPSAVAFVSERLDARRETLPVRAVFTTGETLDAAQRDVIARAFRCEVFESYGSTESVVAAFECEEHRGFHEAAELGITELLPHSGELRAVVGTSLWNDAMPFIRYEMGDLVEPARSPRCPCGRGLPLRFRRIVGRQDDILRSPEGRTVIPVAVRMAVKPHLLPFETYQVQQVDRVSYRVLVAGAGEAPRLGPDRARSLDAALRDVLGADARLSVDAVDRIGVAGAKARTVVNLLG